MLAVVCAGGIRINALLGLSLGRLSSAAVYDLGGAVYI